MFQYDQVLVCFHASTGYWFLDERNQELLNYYKIGRREFKKSFKEHFHVHKQIYTLCKQLEL